LCGEHADWPEELQDADQLTLYATTTRYPGEDEEVTKSEAAVALELAQEVRIHVRKALKQLGMDLSI
jgi:hypothetical protein